MPVEGGMAVYNGNEIVLKGNFGKMFFKYKRQETVYVAEEVTFKFPSEHSINGKHKDAEVQIKHKSEEGNHLVVSILLEIGDPLTVKTNEFLEAVFPEVWIFDHTKERLLTDKPNLNFIAHKGLKAFYNKSFYKYEGSFSTPPCEEGVTHIVM